MRGWAVCIFQGRKSKDKGDRKTKRYFEDVDLLALRWNHKLAANGSGRK